MLRGHVPGARRRGDGGPQCSRRRCLALVEKLYLSHLGAHLLGVELVWGNCLSLVSSWLPSKPRGCAESGLFPAWPRNVSCTSSPLPSSETHTQGSWSGLMAYTCSKFSANPPPFLSQARGRDRVTVQRKDLENIMWGTPQDPKSWRIQMAGLQRHQEPSSREIDPSCKIIRLLIAPAHSYKPWIQACFHCFPVVSHFLLLLGWAVVGASWPAQEEGPQSWVGRD